MAIKRLEITPASTHTWTHQIKSSMFTAHFTSKKEKVVNAEPALHWTMGQRFDAVRQVCSTRGWELIDLRIKRALPPV